MSAPVIEAGPGWHMYSPRQSGDKLLEREVWGWQIVENGMYPLDEWKNPVRFCVVRYRFQHFLTVPDFRPVESLDGLAQKFREAIDQDYRDKGMMR